MADTENEAAIHPRGSPPMDLFGPPRQEGLQQILYVLGIRGKSKMRS
jgi:hypothetical protein